VWQRQDTDAAPLSVTWCEHHVFYNKFIYACIRQLHKNRQREYEREGVDDSTAKMKVASFHSVLSMSHHDDSSVFFLDQSFCVHIIAFTV